MSTVETVRFHLSDGVVPAEFIALDQKMEADYMGKRPGFLSREITRNDDGEYLVIVHWATAEDADATMQAFFGAPETQDFLSSVDKSTVQSGRYAQVER
ncbi:antibiotic biosynthesis monooxygenase family protein [Streptomyces luteolus]|uniref:ABM domain-containing protein n=1 Tax=Streptomyces luteolus TaxID=3043615 RepID=A0ABT6SSF4_9ACTN|nr:hypothetical protein [Streptomyces sp. B-S-A12]MDI3418511.1 hypothetical protein [Streptomyces sp. B-S-A12]